MPGTLGGRAGNGAATSGSRYAKTFRGLAPEAQIVNLRVLDGAAFGADSMVIAALDRTVQLKAQYNIRVINLSLGHPVYESYKKDRFVRRWIEPGTPELSWW